MRVLVTGGTGFIGGHLVDRFHGEGFEVRVLDNLDPRVHPTGECPHFLHGVEFVQGDITDHFLDWIGRRGGVPDQVQDAYTHMKSAGVVVAADGD